MIVSVDINPGVCNNYLKMKEVKTEAEAFFEMRRYLEVNNIYSNITTVFERDRLNYVGDGGESKLVVMGDDQIGDDIEFAIHYDSNPDFNSIDDAIKETGSFAYSYEKYRAKKACGLLRTRYRMDNPEITFESWIPDEYENYLRDLKKREDEICR